MDIGLTLAALPLALPLIALLWIIVRLDGGPGFFAHPRVGLRRTFRCLKLRTMAVDAEARLAAHLRADANACAEWRVRRKLRDDPRVTPIGRFLRATSLDELPQLFNVLIGDMSLVGPRPVTAEELDRYDGVAAAYFTFRPGLTGIWQVSERAAGHYRDRIRCDLRYVIRAGVFYDLWIMLLTFGAVLRRTGT